MAFAKAREILEITLDPDERNFGKLLSIQASAMSSILTATTRVRAGDLRGKDKDGLDDLLARLKAGEQTWTEEEAAEEDLFS